MNDFDAALADAAQSVERTLDDLLPGREGPEARLFEAMRYAILAGGKRLRPFLVVTAADLFAVPRAASLRAAAAVEMLHTYSLVHDDLPCMDDDDLRRGQPTTHVKFDEATAVLAGDALLTIAFEVLGDPATDPDAAVRLQLIRGLAAAAGAKGMCAGQMIDLLAEGTNPDRATIDRLQVLKTGALIAFSCEAGAVLGRASAAERDALREFGARLGRAFQIVDDLLDLEGSAADLGKAVGKDQAAGKATLVALLGAAGARDEAARLAAEAAARLDLFGENAILLRQTAEFAVNRRH